MEKSRANSNGFEQLTKEVSEIHALISSSKALLTWTARDAIQEAREACGGHVSYSKYFSRHFKPMHNFLILLGISQSSEFG